MENTLNPEFATTRYITPIKLPALNLELAIEDCMLLNEKMQSRGFHHFGWRSIDAKYSPIISYWLNSCQARSGYIACLDINAYVTPHVDYTHSKFSDGIIYWIYQPGECKIVWEDYTHTPHDGECFRARFDMLHGAFNKSKQRAYYVLLHK